MLSKEVRDLKKNGSLIYIVTAAGTAAVYIVCTLVFSSISFGIFQIRISEIFTILPYFSWAAVWGLFVGCTLSNLLLSSMALDFIVGGLATLISAILTRLLRKHKWLAPLPPVVINAIMIGGMITYYSVGGYPIGLLFANIGIVAVEQAIVCYGIGLPLLLALERINNRNNFFI